LEPSEFCVLGWQPRCCPLPSCQLGSEWKAGTKATMIINETGFMDLGTFSRTAEIMHEVHGRNATCKADQKGR
jgi:hypothetical protein